MRQKINKLSWNATEGEWENRRIGACYLPNTQQARSNSGWPRPYRSISVPLSSLVPSFSDLVVNNDPAIIFGVMLGNLLNSVSLGHLGVNRKKEKGESESPKE